MFSDVEIIARGFALGEGAVWDNDANTLYYVDITQKRIFALDAGTGIAKVIPTGDMVGCVVPTGDGGLLAAVKNKLIRVNIHTGKQRLEAKVDMPDFVRFNDGKCDVHGRLWVGTMAIDGQDARAEGAGSLYCIENGDILHKYDGFTIANGMAWSADGTCFYHIDTPTRKVDAYTLSANGELSERRTALTLDGQLGVPDGMCIDANGKLWIAMWGGGQVLCADPHSGKILHRLGVQDINVSCCCFGKKDMKTLYITSAQDENGHGGNLFAVRTGVQGTAAYKYGEVRV